MQIHRHKIHFVLNDLRNNKGIQNRMKLFGPISVFLILRRLILVKNTERLIL